MLTIPSTLAVIRLMLAETSAPHSPDAGLSTAGYFVGGFHLPTLQQVTSHDALPKLNRSFELCGPAFADTGNEPLQFGCADRVEAAQPTSRNQQSLCGLKALNAGDDRQQFGIGQGRCAV